MPQNENGFIESLYLREYGRLLRAAYHLTEDKASAENLVHETFILAILRREELASHPEPGAWLARTLRNLLRNEQRAASRGEVPLEEAAEVSAGAPPLPLEDALPAGLGAEERALLIWRFEERLSSGEIAGRLGISEAACRKRISRALARCKRLLDGG